MERNERLNALRAQMAKRNIDIYIVPTSDFHSSEYVGEYFKSRDYLTGFTGSNGTAIVTSDRAGLWTDGRYFIQADKQLAGSDFELFRMGNEGVPTEEEFVREQLPKAGTIGFDGRVMNIKEAMTYKKIADQKGGTLYVKEDLIDNIWEERPPLAISDKKLWILEDKYSGESVCSKLSRIREAMREKKADFHLVSSLYDIAWILNLRGDDIENVPVFLSFLLIDKNSAKLFVRDNIITDEVGDYLRGAGVEILPYDEVYDNISKLPADASILINESIINYRIKAALPETAVTINAADPSEKMKAIKNETELKNTRIAHLKDGVAVTKFMYWLKKNIGSMEITELSAGKYLDSLRASQENFLDLSFEDICAYQSNAAMMHYSATEEDFAILRPEGFLLVDSGGHYLEGTTDITRTFVLGPLSDKQKLHFTAVLASNLNLAMCKFLYGATGYTLDILCRGPVWQLGIDYRCGTGHGVGHILNVHEGPNRFYWDPRGKLTEETRLEEGMITTDEPGIYIEGKYGIRIENELICIKDEKNEYGQFMSFENITYVPIDLDAVIPELLSPSQKEYLNGYHRTVYEKISPFLDEEEKIWLKEYTRPI